MNGLGCHDLENRVQIPEEAKILSAVFRPSLGPAQPPVQGGYRVSFQRAKAAGASCEQSQLQHRLRLDGMLRA